MEITVNLGEGSSGWLQNSRQLAHIIRMLLETLVDVDLTYLSTHNAPCIYESGVRYQMEPPGKEEFAAVPVVIARGWGDCDDLACWRVAELRKHGERAWPRVEWRKFPNGRLYHVVVRRGRYPMEDPRSVEDPSALLGMNDGRHQALIKASRRSR